MRKNQKAVEQIKNDEIKGVVYDADFLNVREYPMNDSEILGTIKRGAEIIIETKESTNDFYKIYNEIGLEGFCMKKFIKLT